MNKICLIVFLGLTKAVVNNHCQEVEESTNITIRTSNSTDEPQQPSPLPKSCASEELNYPARLKCCERLNEERSDFTSCCLYPMLVVYKIQHKKCTDFCAKDTVAPSNCCILNCCLQKLRIMTENPRDGINPEFMARSYLLSVQNDTKWVYPIMSSVAICHNKLAVDKKALEDDENMGCDGLVPKYFYDVVDCAYNLNFVNCAYWNLEDNPKCELTRRYVVDCVIKNPKDLESAVNLV